MHGHGQSDVVVVVRRFILGHTFRFVRHRYRRCDPSSSPSSPGAKLTLPARQVFVRRDDGLTDARKPLAFARLSRRLD